MSDQYTHQIDSLESKLWQLCINRRAATSDEQLERWQSDERAYLTEGFLVTPAPAECAAHIEAAMAEWDAIEASVLSPPPTGAFRRRAKDRQTFLNEFSEARQSYLAGETLPIPLARLCLTLTGKVRNMDWVNLFTWVLPAADPEHRSAHLERAQMVVAVFYLEKIGKALLAPDHQDKAGMRKIETRWQLVAGNE